MDDLNLETLHEGDRVSITTGEGSEQAVYTFSVEVVGKKLTGQLSLARHEDTVFGPIPATLEGSLIKDPEMNLDRPRVKRFGHIIVGGLIMIVDPTVSSIAKRLYLPECTDIAVEWA